MREFLQKYRDANKVQNNLKSGEVIYLKKRLFIFIFKVIDENNFVDSSILSIYNEETLNLSPQTSKQHNIGTISTPNNNSQIVEQQHPAQQITQQNIVTPTTLQPMQMFFDSATGQHYVAVQGNIFFIYI